jgi:SAM-dependent methyltransferase
MASAKSKGLITKPTVFDRAFSNINKTVDYIQLHNTQFLDKSFLNDERTLIVLAFLDAMGYARRISGKVVADMFPEVLTRYKKTISTFSNLLDGLDLQLGTAKYEIGDAMSIPLEDQCVDGIITSPPYSFAIDYVENDLPQLEFLGVDPNELKNSLIGLRGGKKKADRIQKYLEDLDIMISEMARVLKPGKYCVIIIGSNEIQTGGFRFEENVKEFAQKHDLRLEKAMIKPIRGIQNSMTDEYVLFFRKIGVHE